MLEPLALKSPATQWGRWTFNPRNACLEIEIVAGHGVEYQVPADELKSSARILDWIYQLRDKTWATSADIGDLVQAIRDLFGRGVASGGLDHPFDPKPILTKSYRCDFGPAN